MQDDPDTSVDTIAALIRQSEYLKAFDLAEQQIDAGGDSVRLRHLAVLALARMGATDRASTLFRELGLDRVTDNEDVLALEARLLKDLAYLASESARPAALMRAAECYERAYHEAGQGYYPAINVASLSALAGENETAVTWARTARDRAAGGTDYYALATLAEAALILDDRDEAQRLIVAAVASAKVDFAAIGTTRAQLRRLLDAKNWSPDILAPMAAPKVMHFCGHMVSEDDAGRFPRSEITRVQAEIRAAIRQQGIGFAVGSLACGADILIAEAILEAGGELTVVLPFDRNEFVEVSVQNGGPDWVDRFERCMTAARDVHFVTEDAYLGHDELFNYASHLAMGLARLRSVMLGADLMQLAVWDGQPPASGSAAGTAVDLARGAKAGLVQHILWSRADASDRGLQSVGTDAPPEGTHRKCSSMIFGDFKGFSKLTDAQLPVYVDTVLGACGAVLKRHARHLRFRNTWGDGLFLVFDDVVAAADCAFDLSRTLEDLRQHQTDLPDTLGIRLGLHYGPVFERKDPVLERPNFFGFHVSRAARVEPITPVGQIYVTDSAAAALALDAHDRFRCDYVGQVPLAKNYGSLPMYALLPRT